MTNAKTELLELINPCDIECAIVELTYADDIFEVKTLNLKLNHNSAELNTFIDELHNYTYDSGYGLQYISGIIWLNDSTWLNRYEYDGLEYWIHNKVPDIPNELF